MKQAKLLISIICILGVTFCYSQKQNPRKYFNYVNQAELAICDSNYNKAIKNYKQAFKYLKEPFGNDLHNFLYCGFITNNKTVLELCITKYKERDYRTPPFAEKEYEGMPIARFWDSLYTYCPVKSKIDTIYREFIRDLVQRDQQARTKATPPDSIFIGDSINMAQLISYIDGTRIFPTETVVGNEFDRPSNPIRYCLLLLHTAYAGVAKAYKAPPNLHLDKKVLAGEFPPDLYAHLCDSRGYGIDGGIINEDRLHTRFGGDIYFIDKTEKFSFIDKSTWKYLEMVIPIKLNPAEEKEVNKRRTEFYMEPYQDFLKKVKFQRYSPLDFVLVGYGFTSVDL